MQGKLELADDDARRHTGAFLLFGAAQFSRSLVWCVTDLLISYHLVERLGLAGRTAGTILLASFGLGAVLNVAVAVLVGRLGDPAAHAPRLQAIFGIASVVGALLLFGPAPSGEAWTIVYICFTSAVFRITYTVFDVCQNALISLLPSHRAEVGRYVSAKITVSSLGRLVASLVAFAVLRARSDVIADWTVAALVVLPIMISLIGLARVTVPDLGLARDDRAFRWRSLPWRRLMVPIYATIIQLSSLNVVARLLPLYGGGRSQYADSASLVVAMVCGTIVGPTMAYIGTRSAKRLRMVIPMLSLCAAASGAALLHPQGEAASLSLAFTYGATLMAITNLIWERMAVIVADEAGRTGARIDVPGFALLTASINMAIGLSNGVLALVLDGFRAGMSWSLHAITSILVMGGIGTALILLIADDPKRRTPRWLRAIKRRLDISRDRRFAE